MICVFIENAAFLAYLQPNFFHQFYPSGENRNATLINYSFYFIFSSGIPFQLALSVIASELLQFGNYIFFLRIESCIFLTYLTL